MIHVPALAVAVPVMGWGMYRRVHRNIARQKIIPWRLQLRIGILCTIFTLLFFFPAFDPLLAAAQAAGAVGGGLLAWQGLHLTRFDTTQDGCYYKPNPVLGVAVSMLFVGRMIYRFIVLYPTLSSAQKAGQPITSSMLNAGPRSALTIATFGLAMGYFAVYCLGVLHRSRPLRAPAPTG